MTPTTQTTQLRISRPAERRIGRFRDGIERGPRTEASERIGSFGDGYRSSRPSQQGATNR